MYADDTQLYVSYDVTNMEQRQDVNVHLENCINHLQPWMVTNKLKLNGSQTALVVLASSHFSKHSRDLQLTSPRVSVKILPIFLNQHLIMKARVTNISKASCFHII